MRWWRASNVLPFTPAVWFSEKVTYLEHCFVWDCFKKKKTASTSLFFSCQALFNWPHFKMRLHSNQVCLQSSVCVALPRLLCYISVLAVRPVRLFISFSSVFPACSAVSVISCSYSVLLSHCFIFLLCCCTNCILLCWLCSATPRRPLCFFAALFCTREFGLRLVELEIFQLIFGSLESPFGFFHICSLTRGISTVCSTLCVFTLFINATFILVYK